MPKEGTAKKLRQTKQKHVKIAQQVFGKVQLHKLIVLNVLVVVFFNMKLLQVVSVFANTALLDGPHKVPTTHALHAVQAGIRTRHAPPLGVATLAVLVCILLVQKHHVFHVLLDITSRNKK